VGLVRDDERRALRAVDDLRLDVQVAVARRLCVRHPGRELLESLRKRVLHNAFGVGQPKKHLGHARSLSTLSGHQPVLQNGGMPPDSLAARRDRIVARLRRIRVWLLLIVGGVAVALLPWTAYLSATLPSKQLTEHWDVAWAGLDLFEASALIALFVAVVRRSAFVPMFAAAA